MKKNETNYKKNIDYSNESITLIKDSCDYLIENNFYENDELTNLDLLEQSLINYTILKLYSWDINIDNIEINNIGNILKIVNNTIPTEEDKNSYIVQYIHCIIFVYAKINKQPEIRIKNSDSNHEIIYDYDKNILKSITIGKNNELYEIPALLLNKFKSIYNKKEKNPVLTK